MKWTPMAAVPLAVLVVPVQATEYLTVQQAQAQMFPGASFQAVPLQITDQIRETLNERSGVHEPFNDKGVWKVSTGGWFIVDRVVGKHEKITYAVALDAKGAVRAVDILTYQETYGYEVRNANWRAQFVGKTAQDAVQLGKDIRNISGATLSCKHITQGVKRVLAVYDLLLAKM